MCLCYVLFSTISSFAVLFIKLCPVTACVPAWLQSPAMDAKITELLHKVDQLKQQDAAFEEKCRRAQFDHELEVIQLKQGHRNEVQALEREHEDQVEKLERKHANQLADQHDVRRGAYDEDADIEDKLRQLQQKLWEATRKEACLSATCAELVSQAVVSVKVILCLVHAV